MDIHVKGQDLDIHTDILVPWLFTWISIRISVRVSVSHYPCDGQFDLGKNEKNVTEESFGALISSIVISDILKRVFK